MKTKYLLGIALLAIWATVLFWGLARAEVNVIDELKKLPEVNQALIYSVPDSEFDYAATITVAQVLDKKLSFDIGYTPKQEIIGAVTFKLVEVKDYLNFPILKWIVIEPGIYAGWDRLSGINANQKGNAEFSWGPIVKIIEVKF